MSTGALAGLSACGCGHSGGGAIENTWSSLSACRRGVVGRLLITIEQPPLDSAASVIAVSAEVSRRAPRGCVRDFEEVDEVMGAPGYPKSHSACNMRLMRHQTWLPTSLAPLVLVLIASCGGGGSSNDADKFVGTWAFSAASTVTATCTSPGLPANPTIPLAGTAVTITRIDGSNIKLTAGT